MNQSTCQLVGSCPALPEAENKEHKAVQDGEVEKEDSDDGLGLGWELDLGIRGESKTLKRAEAVFRENPKIQTDALLLTPGSRTRAIVKHILQKRFRPVQTSHFSFKYNAPYESTSRKL